MLLYAPDIDANSFAYFQLGASNSEKYKYLKKKKKHFSKILGERALVNNLLKYLYIAEILSYEFSCLRSKL